MFEEQAPDPLQPQPPSFGSEELANSLTSRLTVAAAGLARGEVTPILALTVLVAPDLPRNAIA
jgi:hypothetical protein